MTEVQKQKIIHFFNVLDHNGNGVVIWLFLTEADAVLAAVRSRHVELIQDGGRSCEGLLELVLVAQQPHDIIIRILRTSNGHR